MIPASNSQKTARTRANNEAQRTAILVVDDVQDNRELLDELLRGEGYEEILLAGSGPEALQVLAARSDIGLVLLDLMMPGMDGYEVCQRISENEQTAHIPVIVVTGGAVRRDEALLKSFERGAMDFIPKPVNEVELYGRVKSALLLFHERTRVREKTLALTESQQRFELAVNGVNDGIWDLNLAANEVYFSPQWKKNLGYEDHELPNVMGIWESIVHPEDKAHALACIHEHWEKRTPFYTSEHRLKTKSGDYKWVFSRGRAIRDQDGQVVRMAGSTTDITQRRTLEGQLRQAQQLESIGRLAAGIAHDFNNLLTAIMGHATYMQMHLPGESPFQTSVEHIEKASTRAAELCKQMLAYAGQGSYSVEELDVNPLIHETLELIRISVSKKITFDLQLAPQPLVVKGDGSQLRQVIMNLILNAAEAIGEETGGSIKVITGVVKPTAADLADAVLIPRLSDDSCVQIEVIDSGCGMSKETQEKIFEPFFTTKFTGRGLGLSAVLGIVKAHEGMLKIKSESGHGTTFKILIPRIATPAALLDPKPDLSAELWRGSGTILVVDDEASVLETMDIFLQELGFNILTAENGQEGVDTFLEHSAQISAVILDLTMPLLNGAEAFDRIRKIRPDVPILLCSGYTEEKAVSRFAGKGLAGFLQKPFRISDLAGKLHQCLPAIT